MIDVSVVTETGYRKLDVKTLTFPGGEIHATVQADAVAPRGLLISAGLKSSADVMALIMITDALRRAYPAAGIILDMPYVPYARQDRVANRGESLSAKVFCDLINAQKYSRVLIEDPHSDVVPALLERVQIADPVLPLSAVIDRIGTKVALVAPDAGARKRVLKLASAFDLEVVFADKVRDTRTGQITGTEVLGDLPELPLLVVDDICDGGRTFIELASAIKAKQDTQGTRHQLFLYVTHGIFSKGLDVLLEGYAQVFTRNNWISDDRCTVV
ncbi:ribose-phosphate diphosphokinase [Pararobbsia silviterrae]|uniref:Ribose-phosphate diphosphokinase n=1 Tax=Pararobbsia silviterrae TaxID=1792498 RepID=A0A494XB11_9BURK|nr:ribose-phosphate diphosphokinase [Pararobbsia silviterrae]RKP44763.1 ribose-phosphate diphosphokinase [Pararobbsia silviterrae]